MVVIVAPEQYIDTHLGRYVITRCVHCPECVLQFSDKRERLRKEGYRAKTYR